MTIKEFFGQLKVLGFGCIVDNSAVCNDNGKLACNSDKKNICFCGGAVSGFPSRNTHIDFQMVNSTFHNGSDLVEGIPFFRVTLNAGGHAEV